MRLHPNPENQTLEPPLFVLFVFSFDRTIVATNGGEGGSKTKK